MRFRLVLLTFLAAAKGYAADCSVASSGLEDVMKPLGDKSLEGCYEYTVCKGEGEKKECTTHKVCLKGSPKPSSNLGCMEKEWDKIPTFKDQLILTGPEIY